MNTVFLNFFFNFHALILLSFVMSYLLHLLISKNIIRMTAFTELRFNHVLILLVFTLPVVSFQLSDRFHFKPIAKTYTNIKYKEYKQQQQQQRESEQLALTSGPDPKVLAIETLKNVVLLLLFGSILFSLREILSDYRKLNRLIKNTFLYRSIGKVRVVFSQDVRVPFSFKTLNKAWVIIPLKFADDHNLLKLTVFHELQHHRQKDTLSIYVFQLVKAIAGINPALHHWYKIIFEIQEFKVDEALIDQGKVKRQEYARCLIEVAESVSQIEKQLVCATGLAFLPKRQELTRRIEFMYKKNKTSRVAMAIMAALIMTSMTALALTTSKAIDTRSLSMMDAERMASVARKTTSFPITMNELVLEQLNWYLGTTQGRDYMKMALVRMKQYQPLIESKMAEYNMPTEIMAIPIVESGYQNLPPSANPSRAAGLWQFIASTARVFGLIVNKTVDERMDIEKETDAAMRYLLSNKLIFNSWELSILAYNAGERRVFEGIEKTGSRDAWALIRKGHEGDKGYLAKVMAAILIMKNPTALN